MPLLEEKDQVVATVLADETADGQEHWRYGRYLATTALFTLILYAIPLWIVRRPDFVQLSKTPYAVPLDSAFEQAGQNADVVLFGDSTVMHGIDPNQMSRELGLKVINLPNTSSTLRVSDDLTLVRYLATNRAPRLIVLYLGVWDGDYLHTQLPIGTYEGMEVLAHRGTPREILAYVIKHPADSLEFPFQFYLANGPVWSMLRKEHFASGEEAARTHGHMSNPVVRELRADCSFPAEVTDHLRFDSMKALSARFGNSQTKVLSYLAPVPACGNAATVVDRSYAEISAAAPRELPRSMFRGSILYLHPSADAVPAVTEQLVEAVRKSLGGSELPGGR